MPYDTDIRESWTDAHEAAFVSLKEALMSAPVLAQPNFSKPFTLHTDASGEALGAVLTQDDDDGNPLAIGYASRTLTDVERRYSATESECLAVIWAIEHFRWCLHGHHFKLYSDHQAIQFLMGGGASRSTNRKHHRWLAELQTYDFNICHRPGEDNVVPDALSRCYALSPAHRQEYLAALLSLTLSTRDYAVCHRPITTHGFQFQHTEDGIPLATAARLAACMAFSVTSPEPLNARSQVQLMATDSNRPVVVPDEGPLELETLLCSPTCLAPSCRVSDTAYIVVPDPSRLHHTCHRQWTRYLDSYTTVAYLPFVDGVAAPRIAITMSPVEALAPQLMSVTTSPAPLPHIDQSVVPLQRSRPLHVMELCGGLGIILEAMLRAGFQVHTYTYVDNTPRPRRL